MDKTAIECTNCGGGSDLQVYVTLAALLVAGLALVMNFVQFRVFLNEVRARAMFEISLLVQGGGEEGVVRVGDSPVTVRVELAIRNTGNRAAGSTAINVLVPCDTVNFRWCGSDGAEIEGDDGPSRSSHADPLRAPDGSFLDAQYLPWTLERVGVRPHFVFRFQFDVEVEEGATVNVPVRATVQAEELPDDIEECEENLMVTVTRGNT